MRVVVHWLSPSALRIVKGHVKPGQSLAIAEIGPEKGVGILPEIGFADTGTVDGATGVSFGIIENFDFKIIGNVGSAVVVPFHNLAIDHIERRQDGENRKFSIHAVHTKIICGNYGRF